MGARKLDNDFILVLGVCIGALTFPAIVSAFSYGKPPRSAVLYFVTGGALVSWAVYKQPNTYSVDGFPDLFLKVIGNLIG